MENRARGSGVKTQHQQKNCERECEAAAAAVQRAAQQTKGMNN